MRFWEMTEKFSEEVKNKIGLYVYRLIDPRNGETFYVGQGRGNRAFQHVEEATAFGASDDIGSLKVKRIKAIKSAGLRVGYVIHRHDIPAAAIDEVEAALIDAYPGLTNIQGGYGSGAKGPMSVNELEDKYALPALDHPPTEKLVLININNLENDFNEDAIYNQTRMSWRIDEKKASRADYVISVIRGRIVGAFVATQWVSATHENFPKYISLSNEIPGRKGFYGKKAPDDIWEKFVGKRGKRIIIEEMKHIQNPIRYWNID
jgi:uncharacterized protein